MKRTPLLRIRFELRGQALKNMAKIIETQEQEISILQGNLNQKDQLIIGLQVRLDQVDPERRCH